MRARALLRTGTDHLVAYELNSVSIEQSQEIALAGEVSDMASFSDERGIAHIVAAFRSGPTRVYRWSETSSQLFILQSLAPFDAASRVMSFSISGMTWIASISAADGGVRTHRQDCGDVPLLDARSNSSVCDLSITVRDVNEAPRILISADDDCPADPSMGAPAAITVDEGEPGISCDDNAQCNLACDCACDPLARILILDDDRTGNPVGQTLYPWSANRRVAPMALDADESALCSAVGSSCTRPIGMTCGAFRPGSSAMHDCGEGSPFALLRSDDCDGQR